MWGKLIDSHRSEACISLQIFLSVAMAEDVTGKSRIPVQPIKLGVLGGTFTVQAVYADSAQKVDAVVTKIRSTEADRWFVMLSEGRDSDLDELALIDDAFEFQTLAAGTLESE